MEDRQQLIWISIGMIVAFLTALLVSMAYHAIVWGPLMLDICSVTWNDGPTI